MYPEHSIRRFKSYLALEVLSEPEVHRMNGGCQWRFSGCKIIMIVRSNGNELFIFALCFLK